MRYHKPTSFEDAAQLAFEAQGVTRFLAGGTDVLVQMRAGGITPEDVIDIKDIPGAKEIAPRADGGWRIGAAVSGMQLSRCAALQADWPGIVEGLELVGSTQIQGRATLTGNLCNGSPAADSVPALIAAGATAHVVGPKGARDVAIADIPAGPGRTHLERGEVIAAIDVPPRGAGGADAYLRFIPRTEMDIAVVGCAVNLRVEGKTITEACVALGAVAPTIITVAEAAEAIIGTALDEAALTRIAEVASSAARPISDKRGSAEFRTDVAGVLAKRTAQIAYDRAMARA